MEDETHKEFPSIHLLYRPVRQMVYAILFNLHHYMYMASKNKEKGGECITWILIIVGGTYKSLKTRTNFTIAYDNNCR
jgi:hypothetical protein